MATPHEAVAAYRRQTQAERFVDDVTFLRMMRVAMPGADPGLGSMDGTSISDRHSPGSHHEEWNTPLTDIARRFPDGSLAYRLRDTQRWEVWRTW